jgi:hypothetical protein
MVRQACPELDEGLTTNGDFPFYPRIKAQEKDRGNPLLNDRNPIA